MTVSRLFPGEWRRRAVTVGGRCGFFPSYPPSRNDTSAGENAEGLQIATPSLTASGASGVASNAPCRAIRDRNRRGCTAHGSVLVRQEQARQLRSGFTWISPTGSLDGQSNTSLAGIACNAGKVSVALRRASEGNALLALLACTDKRNVLNAAIRGRTDADGAAIAGSCGGEDCIKNTATTERNAGSMECHTTHL